MPALNVALVQSDLRWHDPASNRNRFAKAIDAIAGHPDLIVLPEMFTTGFSMDAPRLAEPMDGESVAWMQQQAKARDAAVCGSLIVGEGGNFHNRFICALPSGDLVCYDKRHLFRLANEQDHYAAGDSQVAFEFRGWRLFPLVCYDLRFPVWSRNRESYDLLLYVANWPERRHFAWETLLRARAIENLAYVAGVNRVGLDGNDINYAGGSAVLDFLGQDVANLGTVEGTATAALDLDRLRAFRERFAFHKDADAFSIDV